MCEARGWYCLGCKEYIDPQRVTFCETHDHDSCNSPVVWHDDDAGQEFFELRATLAAIRAALESETLADYVTAGKCNDTGHDDRWCARCNALGDGAEMMQQRLLAILDGNQAPSATTPGSEEADDAR